LGSNQESIALREKKKADVAQRTKLVTSFWCTALNDLNVKKTTFVIGLATYVLEWVHQADSARALKPIWLVMPLGSNIDDLTLLVNRSSISNILEMFIIMQSLLHHMKLWPLAWNLFCNIYIKQTQYPGLTSSSICGSNRTLCITFLLLNANMVHTKSKYNFTFLRRGIYTASYCILLCVDYCWILHE